MANISEIRVKDRNGINLLVKEGTQVLPFKVYVNKEVHYIKAKVEVAGLFNIGHSDHIVIYDGDYSTPFYWNNGEGCFKCDVEVDSAETIAFANLYAEGIEVDPTSQHNQLKEIYKTWIENK